jgi:succinate dehydrogenase / fumarate reductase cytochrome b subunit
MSRKPDQVQMKAARAGVRRWFNSRDGSQTAFLFQRVTGIGLTLYFVIHVFNIGNVSGGSTVWSALLNAMESPLSSFMLILMLAGLGFHFVNGVRLMLAGLGVMLPRPERPNYPYHPRFFNTTQKIFVGLAVAAAFVFALLGYLFIFVGV